MIRHPQRTARTHAPLSSLLAAIASVAAAATPGPADAATANRPPRISGQPATYVKAATWYSFRPTAFDADGQRLTFSIRNKPAWATFSRASGRLSGTPPKGAAGRVFRYVSIHVSDGRRTTALPAFAIRVGPANRAPRISGTPHRMATVGKPYSFRPTVSDADHDRLRFRIANKPAWANFDASTGTLWGTPRSIGSWSNVAISVTDNAASATLPRFTLRVARAAGRTATLQWDAPTHNVDGTRLTDLMGYRVAYGTTPGQYSTRLEVRGAATTSVIIEGLGTGRHYFAAKAVTRSGELSDFSREVSKAFN